KINSPSVSILWKRAIEAVLLIGTREFFNNSNKFLHQPVLILSNEGVDCIKDGYLVYSKNRIYVQFIQTKWTG
ncbi:hypothetical protein, partial [Leptospira interrogans]|uniref:hypothetical protein n=5 Tax=Leptospira interrogans TaxID=173 RepID=UPI0002BA93B2